MNQAKYTIEAFLILAGIAVAALFFNRILLAETKKEVKDSEVIKVSPVSIPPSKGKQLFVKNCASCHHVFREINGPALANFEERGPWKDRKKVYEWINNPASFMQQDIYTQSLMRKYKVLMTAFPSLTGEDIDAIIEYIHQVQKAAM